MSITPHEFEHELLEPIPRRADFTASQRLMRRIAWNIYLALFCIAYGVACLAIAPTQHLVTNGKTAVATIHSREAIAESEKRNHNQREYMLRYSFVVDGQAIEGTKDVYAPEYKVSRVGDTFPVTYAPENPHNFRPKRMTQADVIGEAAGAFTFMTCFFGLAGLGLYALDLSQRGQLHLLKKGVPVVGVIVRKVQVEGEPRKIVYRYVTPFRSQEEVTVAVTSEQFERVEQGATVTVLCDPATRYGGKLYRLITVAKIEGAPDRDL
jgi:hypothetical protein